MTRLFSMHSRTPLISGVPYFVVAPAGCLELSKVEVVPFVGTELFVLLNSQRYYVTVQVSFSLQFYRDSCWHDQSSCVLVALTTGRLWQQTEAITDLFWEQQLWWLWLIVSPVGQTRDPGMKHHQHTGYSALLSWFVSLKIKSTCIQAKDPRLFMTVLYHVSVRANI